MLVHVLCILGAADGGGELGQFALGPTLLGAPGGAPRYIIKSSNRTVTLILQSGRYSVDNYTGINC